MASAEQPLSPHERQQERITLGLLEYTNRHALDEDYAIVAARQAETGGRRKLGGPAAIALIVFGVMVAIATTQTSRGAAEDERGRAELISQIKQAKKQLGEQRSDISALTAENQRLQEEFLSGSQAGSGAQEKLRTLSIMTGATKVRGSGVRLVIGDGKPTVDGDGHVIDKDLQRIVNGLWQAGAEAVSINGQRLTPLSAIRHAGSAITVNYTSLSQPYVVLAIGDPDTLPSRFAQSTSGATWLAVQKHFNMQFELTTKQDLSLPAAEIPQLRSARQRKG